MIFRHALADLAADAALGWLETAAADHESAIAETAAEELRRKEKHLVDNALPQWYLDSSVSAVKPPSPLQPKSSAAATVLGLPPESSPLKHELGPDGFGHPAIEKEKRARDDYGTHDALAEAPAKKIKTDVVTVKAEPNPEPDDDEDDDGIEFEDAI